MKFLKAAVLLPALLLGALSVQAHTQLAQATPGDGAVMHQAPSSLDLGFTDDVQLLKFELVHEGGVPVAVGFKPVSDARKTFAVPLPSLPPSSYKASWTVLGKDGHRVEGSLKFSVNPEAEEVAGTTGNKGNKDQHKH